VTQPKKKVAKTVVEPIRVEIRLIGIERVDGVVVGEKTLAEGTVPPVDFARLPTIFADAVAEHNKDKGTDAQ
jgi:hypothetical protein